MDNTKEAAKLHAKMLEKMINDYITMIVLPKFSDQTSKDEILALAEQIAPRYVQLILDLGDPNDSRFTDLLSKEIIKIILKRLEIHSSGQEL